LRCPGRLHGSYAARHTGAMHLPGVSARRALAPGKCMAPVSLAASCDAAGLVNAWPSLPASGRGRLLSYNVACRLLSLSLIPGRGDGSPPRSSPGSSIGVLGRIDSGHVATTLAAPGRVLVVCFCWTDICSAGAKVVETSERPLPYRGPHSCIWRATPIQL